MEREFFPEFYFGGSISNNNEAMKSAGKKLHTKEPHQFVDFDFTSARQKAPNFGTGTGTHNREENVTVANFSSHILPTRSSVNFNGGDLGSDLGESSTSMNSLGFHEKDVFFEKDQQGKRNKRKGKGASELDSRNKRVEDEENGSDARKLNQRTSSRRSRSAEMHNLSERRRRDKINEKLKALQELLPHCTKTDKASMLDEAIEYLKSLQIQLQQMMWIESGMAPMIFPDTHHHQYMSITAVDHPHPHHHHHHHHHHHDQPLRITRPLFDDQSKLRDLNANQQLKNSPPRQTLNENLYLHKFSPQGTNQRGFGARTVQEQHFGDGLAIDRNTLL